MCLLNSDCNTILLNKSMNFFETKRLQHREKRFHVARVIAPFCAKQNFVWRKKKKKNVAFCFLILFRETAIYFFCVVSVCVVPNSFPGIFCNNCQHKNIAKKVKKAPRPEYILSFSTLSEDTLKKVILTTDTHMKSIMVKALLQSFQDGTTIQVLLMETMPFRSIFSRSTCLSSIQIRYDLCSIFC